MSSNTINVHSTSHAEFVPEIWAARGLNFMWEESGLVRVVNKDFSTELLNQGDTVNVPVYGNLTAKTKTADSQITLQTVAGKKVAVVLDFHKEVSFIVEDVLSAQASTSVIDGYMRKAARALVDDIVTTIATEYANAGLSTGDGSTALSEDTVLAARKALNGIYAPKTDRYFFVQDMTPLLKLDRFTAADKLNDGSSIRAGDLMGKIHGFTVMEEVRLVDLTGSAGAVHNLAMTPDGVLLVSRALPLPPPQTGVIGTVLSLNGLTLRVLMTYNPNYLGTQITVDILYGVKVPNESTTGYVAPLVDVMSS